MKEREGKEGRRLKWILFNDFKIMLIECNGRNVLSQVMSVCLSLSLFLSMFCFIYYHVC